MALPAGLRNYTYDEDNAVFRTRTQKALWWIILLLIVTAPIWVSGYWFGLLNLMGITVIAAVGLNLIIGYCGQLSLGHAGFIAAGAYTSAVLTGKFNQPFIFGLIAAGLVAGALGALTALPSLKIKGWKLALVTLAVQFIVLWVIEHWTNVTGGTAGLSVSGIKLGALDVRTPGSQFYLIMLIMILTVFFGNNLARTRTGRAFVGIRDNERAAAATGVNLFRYKLLAFGIGCSMAGVTGALLAHSTGLINSGMFGTFGFTQSIIYLGILLIGGFGTMWGPILGTIIAVLITNQLAPSLLGTKLLPTDGPSWLATAIVVVVSIVFLALLPNRRKAGWKILKG